MNPTRIGRFGCLAVAVLAINCLFLATVMGAAAPSSPEQFEYFETHIRPVLIKHCYECHAVGAKTVRGGLLLDTRGGIRAGGDSGPAVVPAKPDESLLLEALRYESLEMPPDGKLPAETIARFEKWIADGATDPRAGTASIEQRDIDLNAGRQFWAFRPVVKPQSPPVRDISWPHSSIDQFLLVRLEAESIGPSNEADAATLLRRAKFDLLGLPPTPAEIRAFVHHPSRLAFRRLIDGWLNSPQFGQRWGRHWLDVARFAESSGGGRSLMFPDAWRYRDYVVHAFNADVPFDQFIREQIAGDLLEYSDQVTRDRNIVATGFLTLGPTNYELQDKELLEMEVVDEQIDTIGRAFLGLTLGCARCHDHKFDPIPMNDYYALAGIFASTESVEHSNVSKYVEHSLKSDPAWSRHELAQKRLAKLQAELKSVQRHAKQLRTERDKLAAPGIVVDDDQAELVGKWQPSTSVPHHVGKQYLFHTQNGETSASATFAAELPTSGQYEVLVAYSYASNRPPMARVTVHHRGGAARLLINQQTKPSIDTLYERLGVYDFTATEKARVSISTAGSNGFSVIADAVRFVPVENAEANDPVDKEKRETLQVRIAEAEQRAKTLQQQIKDSENHSPRKPTAMSVRDRSKSRDIRLLIRGEIRKPGPLVRRGFVSVASPAATPDGKSAPASIAPGNSGRRELAEWLASAENPLTARVMVNRVWHHLIGSGLVRSVDNFGVMGDPPTHPELLDYLAADFVESGWSVKQLIRQIVLSRVYQLDSRAERSLITADPRNQLLARANRRRLDAEAIRDAMLSISGLLDTAAGGLTINKITQYDVDYKFDSRLRSVYVPRFRNSVLELFQTFDVANPNIATGRRNTSVLPTQALFLMNSEFVAEQAEHAAQRLIDTVADRQTRRENAFLMTLGRLPTAGEQQLIESLLTSDQDKDEVARWSEVFHLLFGSIDFRYLY